MQFMNQQEKQMADFDIQYAANSLRLLADMAIERETDLVRYNRQADIESTDEECDSLCPIFDTFYEEGGGEAIRSMKCFDSTNFETWWNLLYEHVSRV